ncbi:DEAD-box ATP-dependent RNA helicase 56-like isoform X1 [Melia azedarach]|uniref:DEAD-box ATP-dependent RNA helicase 56-like isoform X1 n=1 Tax=Melia azedarach TaxID=155640 RepID=A0ACC1XWU1_MELAZ|nr:DEAD-box ATP-dependent RNA helicase 56-like isoform X1 [Melia azedarach]
MPKAKQKARKLKDCPRFISDKAEHFEEHLKNKKLLLEKGFHMQDSPSLGLPSYVSEVIVQQGWNKFVQNPDPPLVAVVKEFYANWLDPEKEVVTVKGTEVDCSVGAINHIYGLVDIADECSEFTKIVTKEQNNEALQLTTKEDTQWIVSTTEKRIVIQNALTPATRVWYHFIKFRLRPTTNDDTVSQSIILLIYALLIGLSINIGSIILAEMRKCISKAAGQLYFPSTITMLCAQAGVIFRVRPTKEVLSNKALISIHTINRLLRDTGIKHPTNRAPPLTTPQAAKSNHSSNFSGIFERLDKQDTRHALLCDRLHKFWEYSHQRDQAIKRALQRNFTKPIPPLPNFPTDILSPWTATASLEDMSSEEESDN